MRHHLAQRDARGLWSIAVGGVRQAVRRAAPVEMLLWRWGRYPHRTRSRYVPTYRAQSFTWPPGIERISATRFLVDLDTVTTYCGFSFAPGGWHPLLAALEEHIADPSLRYEDSVLCRFYERFTPASVKEAVFVAPDEPLHPLDGMPAVHKVLRALWHLDRRQVDRLVRAAPHQPVIDDQSRYIGPKRPAKGAWHLAKVVGVYESVHQHGYDPDRFGGELPKGYFLVRGDKYRFVIGHGQRRLPALYLAGVRRIVCTFLEHSPPVVDEAHLERWSTPAGGPYPLPVARRLFDELFAATGAKRRKALRLP